MRVLLVHNPDAGGGGPAKDDLLALLREGGYEPLYRSTDEFKAAADTDAVELVAVAGGDGTVGKVARRLAGGNLPIAVLPLGTANNIAVSLGISGELRWQIGRWRTAARRPFDVGRLVASWGEELFLESVGGGLFATLMTAVNHEKDRDTRPQLASPDGALAYAVQQLRRMLREAQASDWQVELDGTDHCGRYLLAEAMNIPCIGPNLVLAPGADFSDGLLDVVLLGEADRERLDDYLRRRTSGAEVSAGLDVRRARHVTLTPGEQPHMHADDHLRPDRQQRQQPGQVRLQLQSHALTFLVP